MQVNGTFGSNRGFREKAAFLALLALLVAPSMASATPAAPAILGPAQGVFVNTPAVTVHGTSSGDSVAVRIYEGLSILAETGPTNGFWSAAVGFADGAHTITARARDAGGIWGPTSPSRTFTVDTVSPTAPAISAPADGQLIGFSNITVEGTAEPGARVRLDVDTGAPLYANADNTGTWMIEHDYQDATHTVRATAIDRAGNESLPSTAVRFTVDTFAPGAPQVSLPGNGSFTNQTAVTISGTAEPGVAVRVFEGATIVMTTPATDATWSGVATFSPGAHTVTARSVDAAGNAGPASAPVSFTIDLIPPGAPTIDTPSEGAFVASPVTLAGTAEPFARVDLIADTTIEATATASKTGAFSFTLGLASGPYSYVVRATDRAGNQGPVSAERTFTADDDTPSVLIGASIALFLPTQPPVISGSASDQVGVARIRVDYYDLLGKRAFSKTASCEDCPAGHHVDWTIDFDPGPGRYEVYAYAIDRVGHESLPAKIVVTRL